MIKIKTSRGKSKIPDSAHIDFEIDGAIKSLVIDQDDMVELVYDLLGCVDEILYYHLKDTKPVIDKIDEAIDLLSAITSCEGKP